MTVSRRRFFRQLAASALAGAAIPSFGELSSAEIQAQQGLSSGSQGSRLIRLDKNVNPYGPSPKVTEAIRANLGLANQYPDNEYASLTAQIASLHKVKPEQVTLGAGSREILRMAVAAYLTGHKRLVFASPSFEPIVHLADEAEAEIVAIPLNKRYQHDLDATLGRTNTSTGLIYICNPNNPTGSLTPRKDIEAFLKKLPSQTAVLIDEAYHDYVGLSSDYASFIDHPVDDERVIVVRTFSKIYGLAGLRVGYAVSSAEASRRLSSSQLQWGVNIFAARAAAAALDDPDYVRHSAKRNADDRQEFYNQTNARMLRQIDSLTNFVFAKVDVPSIQFIEYFKQNQILLGPVVPEMDGYVRVSIGTREDMREFWRVWHLLPAHGMAM